jgi:hypothetical protein
MQVTEKYIVCFDTSFHSETTKNTNLLEKNLLNGHIAINFRKHLAICSEKDKLSRSKPEII